MICPIPPAGHEIVRDEWADLFAPNSSLFNRYLISLAIESNVLESVFFISGKVRTLFIILRIQYVNKIPNTFVPSHLRISYSVVYQTVLSKLNIIVR